MQKKIAVERSLTNVHQALQGSGFQTVELDLATTSEVGAIVISGQDQNFLGMHDTDSAIPVINAEGLTADDVLKAVKKRIG